MNKLLSILFLLFLSSNLVAKEKMLVTHITFSPFQDTIVGGFEIEIQIKSELNYLDFSITSTNCSVMLKDASRGIYVVKAPMTSVGKKSIIKVSGRMKNGKRVELISTEVPIVAMTKEMRNRYTNYLMHKK